MLSVKQSIRKAIKRKIGLLSELDILTFSDIIAAKVIASSFFQSAAVVCAYLPMVREVQTEKILCAAFAAQKKVFVPKVIGTNPEDMIMCQIFNMEEILSMPRTQWGIPEPSTDGDNLKIVMDASSLNTVDLVICPGVAFDDQCRRLGHGKGYYGTL
jgi:5-formyltetrahydrofolate cyclo-ligase